MGGISDLVRQAASNQPDRTALIDGATRLTWAQCDEAISHAARAYLATGLRAGDRVAIQLGTSADFATLYLGALRAGLVVVPVNPGYTVPELREVLQDSGAGLLVTSSVSAIEAVADLPVAHTAAAAPSAPEPAGTLGELLAGASANGDPHADRTAEDLALLLYTSGTSGRPRGAMLSVRAVLANLDQLAAADPPLIMEPDVAFVPLPLFHVFGLNAGLGMALHAGATTVLYDRFDPAATLEVMRRERVTIVIGAPAMFAQWLNEPGFAGGFESMRVAISGSAALPAFLVGQYRRRGVTLLEGYGLTEAAPAVTLTWPSPKAGSIGRPLPGVQVRLRDADGDPVGDEFDPGELLVRGPNLFSGYWPDGADGPDRDGWFATGDIAVSDEDGGLVLVGRTTDLVLINGFNVYPAEVESVLAACPGVAEVAVVGVDDPHTGEALIAYVVPAPNARLDATALIDTAARSLARFKLPRDVRVVDQLPHTATGKVMKWRLVNAGG
jgi:long-chain acyl-CoA synthetase